MQQIADVAGVSRGTVDRVLHDRGHVNEDLKERIKTIAKNLGYISNNSFKTTAPRNPIKIGVLFPSLNNAFFDLIVKGMREAENEYQCLGVEIVLKEVEGYEEAVHLNAIDYLIKNNCNAFCLATISTDLITRKINNLYDEKRVVILVNSDVKKAKRYCYVGPNYLQNGSTSAKMLSLLNKEDKLNILIVNGSRYMFGHTKRIEGFLKELENSKTNYQIVDVVESQDYDDIAKRVTSQALDKYPHINCIYITGAGTEGVCSSLIEHNRLDIVVTAYDILDNTKDLISSGILKFVVCQEPFRQGYHSIKRACQALYFKPFYEERDDLITNTIIKISTNI